MRDIALQIHKLYEFYIFCALSIV